PSRSPTISSMSRARLRRLASPSALMPPLAKLLSSRSLALNAPAPRHRFWSTKPSRISNLSRFGPSCCATWRGSWSIAKHDETSLLFVRCCGGADGRVAAKRQSRRHDAGRNAQHLLRNLARCHEGRSEARLRGPPPEADTGNRAGFRLGAYDAAGGRPAVAKPFRRGSETACRGFRRIQHRDLREPV